MTASRDLAIEYVARAYGEGKNFGDLIATYMAGFAQARGDAMRFALTLRNRNVGPGIHIGYHKSHADAETARAAITVLLGLVREHDMYLEIQNVGPPEVP